MHRQDRHYLAVAELYGPAVAARTGIPLINHIHEGLRILQAMGSGLRAQQAFCIHPLLQEAGPLSEALTEGSILQRYAPDTVVVVLAMEYRSVANAYLSEHCTGPDDLIRLSPLPEVNHMLIADKVQNRKDFKLYHQGRHPQSERLARYFANWLAALGVSEEQYQSLAAAAVG